MLLSYPYRIAPRTPYWGATNAQAKCDTPQPALSWNSLRDDLSMLIATSTVLHRVFTFDKSLTVTVYSGLVLTTLMAGFITWHCIVDETLMHPILFGIMVVIVGNKTRQIIKARILDDGLRRQLQMLARWGAIFFGSGFALWNVDNAFCDSLTATKRSIGMPWSFILELHGWWHIFTGIGAYIFIALVEYLTSDDVGQPLGKSLAWPASRLVPGTIGQRMSSKNDSGVTKSNGGKGSKLL
ncbi:hypothetical protein OIDMADRAFT_155471 [Oidiodendron maius Zn]|uniref:Uncharacterized protein n=1 Tax=Oidiodendron maius (strain Zn) TaxID=913774 RepID=A0A0C3D504_OIDMZ|nr:hypothetical protein OIDMADRAFT_155471 [Oidiodendron maius Zn]